MFAKSSEVADFSHFFRVTTKGNVGCRRGLSLPSANLPPCLVGVVQHNKNKMNIEYISWCLAMTRGLFMVLTLQPTSWPITGCSEGWTCASNVALTRGNLKVRIWSGLYLFIWKWVYLSMFISVSFMVYLTTLPVTRIIQDDYKLCERLHKFIDKKVIATQKLNSRP
jgi:hypothetical protein